jgi:hypothetical protein
LTKSISGDNREVRKETPKPREVVFICIFCDRADHLNEFYFRRKRIEKRHFDYARNSYRDELIDFPPCSYSHDHMVLIHERTTLCLDALVTAHVLIVVIISRVGPFFLLEGLTLTLSPDTWTVHIFPVVVHIPLGQMVKC